MEIRLREAIANALKMGLEKEEISALYDARYYPSGVNNAPSTEKYSKDKAMAKLKLNAEMDHLDAFIPVVQRDYETNYNPQEIKDKVWTMAYIKAVSQHSMS